ncbi:hypothetical protein BDW02DRAFT_232909 [Decorospora gaudefroyi]|uniref:Uncharacterized protein n=1 Tax=Decorospora gaudefroyi TaxID=184978 RepID=A0A6A5KW62_9PLEO|nr:hypothetical protein BDW02DRAFT_232909 [Decorospora gaudefroyi]
MGRHTGRNFVMLHHVPHHVHSSLDIQVRTCFLIFASRRECLYLQRAYSFFWLETRARPHTCQLQVPMHQMKKRKVYRVLDQNKTSSLLENADCATSCMLPHPTQHRHYLFCHHSLPELTSHTCPIHRGHLPSDCWQTRWGPIERRTACV